MTDALMWSRQVLSNGITVLLYPKKTALTAQLSVAIKYGSNDDPAEKAGRAHFLEHMLVGGSKKRISLHNQIEKIGGCSSFETSAECTFATIDVFPKNLPEASSIMSKLLFTGEFEEGKMEIERKVILNEINQTADNPHDKIAETLIKSLFKKHPIRNPVLGTKSTIKTIISNELTETHRIHYVADNIILILTGNFSKINAQKILLDFQNVEKREYAIKTKKSVSEDVLFTKQKKLKRSGINQAYLCFGLQTPSAKDPYAKTFDLINAVLGMGESSRLFVELREKRALTYNFSSMNISGLDYGFFSIACSIHPKLVKQTEKIIKRELEKIGTNPVNEDELQKSKNVLIGDILRAMDNPHELPRIMTDTEIVYENPRALSAYVKDIRHLAAKNLVTVAEKFFQEKNYSTVVMTSK